MRSIQSHSGVPEVNQQFVTLLEIPSEWKNTSTTQDLQTIESQSIKEDWSQEAPVIAEKDRHAPSQRCIHWIIITWSKRCHLRRTQDGALQAFKRPDLEAVFIFNLKIAHDRGWIFCQNWQLCDRQKALVILKLNRHNSHTKFFSQEDYRKSQTLQAQQTQCTHSRNQQWETRSKLKARCRHANSRRTRTVPNNEDQEKTSWIKLLVSKQKIKWCENYLQRTTTRSNKMFLGPSRIFFKNKAISKLMKCSWPQTL